MVKKIAFTLAEVLIVLMIIGIIAEITIPTLVKNIQTAETVSMLKKEYSVMQQATNEAMITNGTPDTWSTDPGWGQQQGATDLKNIYAKYLKYSKQCEADTSCYPTVYYLNSASTWQAPDASTLQLADGSIWIFRKWSTTNNSVSGTGPLSNAIGVIHVDLNGFKNPNMIGKDIFRFELTASGVVVPSGVPDDTNSFDTLCSNYDTSTSAGQGCTAWVIYNDNMDYLKCTNLGWNGKKTC